MDRPRILLLVAYPAPTHELASAIHSPNYDVQIRSAHSSAAEHIHHLKPDAVIVEHSGMRGRQGLERAREIKSVNALIPVILVSREGSERLVLEALREGLQDYFTLPVAREELVAAVERTLRQPWKRRSGESTAEGLGMPRMVGRIGPLRETKASLVKAASSNCTVLIGGETGTGKELVAEFVHQNSPRKDKPFVCINCAAIPDTLLESELFGHTKGAFTGAEEMRDGFLTSANGGTIFLDEIGDMSLFAQAKMLRVLDRKEVYRLGGRNRTLLDIRFIAATNQDLQVMSNQGSFRKDVYFRLNVACFHMLPLRERKEDIPLLVDHFGKEFSRQAGSTPPEFSEEFLRCLMRYEWPGNIRELKNLIESLLAGEIPRRVGAEELPPYFRGAMSFAGAHLQTERERLLSALSSSRWNKSKAAAELHWSRMTLYRKLAKYQIARAG